MLSLQCPKCGATVKFDEDHIGTFCTFCGAHLGDMTEYVKKAAQLNINKKMHEINMEVVDKEIRKSKIQGTIDTIKNISDIVLVTICLLPAILVILFIFKII